MSKKAHLLWLDLEMTGLDPAKDRILEVAAIATDWQFNELATYESAVHQPRGLMRRRMTGEFWQKNAAVRGALRTASATGPAASRVEQELIKFLSAHFSDPIYLAGNSIHQDRKFIEHYWPALAAKLHYRMLDVSAWKIYFQHVRRVKFNKPEAHRALDDIRGSIEELKCYLKKIS